MANYAVKYVKDIDSFLNDEHEDDEIKIKMECHLKKISFFQYERLIHLLVTMLFAIMDIIMLTILLIQPCFTVCVLTVLFTILLIPYIFHYYFLENSVQKMYNQYDDMVKMLLK